MALTPTHKLNNNDWNGPCIRYLKPTHKLNSNDWNGPCSRQFLSGKTQTKRYTFYVRACPEKEGNKTYFLYVIACPATYNTLAERKTPHQNCRTHPARTSAKQVAMPVLQCADVGALGRICSCDAMRTKHGSTQHGHCALAHYVRELVQTCTEKLYCGCICQLRQPKHAAVTPRLATATV